VGFCASRHGTLTSTEGLFVAKCVMPDEPIAPSPEGAAAALRQIARAWELDRSDTMALILAGQADFSTIEWTQERLTRVAFLMELENALFKLQPRGGVPRWLSTAKPGPFFGDQSPLQILTGPTSDIAALLREVRAWTGRH